jgi:3D (Asp-Asp-Asp) domain-containing protein
MSNKDKAVLLVIGWGILLTGLIVLACEVSYQTDLLNRKFDLLHEDIVNLDAEEPERVATVTDATPAEPVEVSKELNIYFGTPSEPQEDTEEIVQASEATETTAFKEEATEEPVEGSGGELEYAGIFELTAYTWTGNPCANGNYPTAGHTVASNYFPLGTRIYIEGMGEYVVEDIGGMATNVIDVYIEGSDNCKQFGRRQAGIYIVK